MRLLATSIQDCEALLIDVGGTLMRGDQAIEGAADFLFELKKNRVPFFITVNNVAESTQEVLQKLKMAGCGVTLEQMITASQAAIAFAQRQNVRSVRVMGTATQAQEWTEAGFDTTTEKPDAMVLGLDTQMNYYTLTQAMRAIHRGAFCIALSDTTFHMVDDGVAPGVGPVVQYLREVTGKYPDAICGKPHRTMMDYVSQRVGVPAAHIAIVGDQLTADMKMAEEYGMVSALVLSGQTSREDLREHPYQPDYVVESIESLITLFR